MPDIRPRQRDNLLYPIEPFERFTRAVTAWEHYPLLDEAAVLAATEMPTWLKRYFVTRRPHVAAKWPKYEAAWEKLGPLFRSVRYGEEPNPYWMDWARRGFQGGPPAALKRFLPEDPQIRRQFMELVPVYYQVPQLFSLQLGNRALDPWKASGMAAAGLDPARTELPNIGFTRSLIRDWERFGTMGGQAILEAFYADSPHTRQQVANLMGIDLSNPSKTGRESFKRSLLDILGVLEEHRRPTLKAMQSALFAMEANRDELREGLHAQMLATLPPKLRDLREEDLDKFLNQRRLRAERARQDWHRHAAVIDHLLRDPEFRDWPATTALLYYGMDTRQPINQLAQNLALLYRHRDPLSRMDIDLQNGPAIMAALRKLKEAHRRPLRAATSR